MTRTNQWETGHMTKTTNQNMAQWTREPFAWIREGNGSMTQTRTMTKLQNKRRGRETQTKPKPHVTSNRYRGIDRKKRLREREWESIYAVQLCLLTLLHQLINTSYLLLLHEENKQYVAMIQYVVNYEVLWRGASGRFGSWSKTGIN